MNIFTIIFMIIVCLGIVLSFVAFAYNDIKTMLSAIFILGISCFVFFGMHYIDNSRNLEMINVEVNDTFNY